MNEEREAPINEELSRRTFNKGGAGTFLAAAVLQRWSRARMPR